MLTDFSRLLQLYRIVRAVGRTERETVSNSSRQAQRLAPSHCRLPSRHALNGGAPTGGPSRQKNRRVVSFQKVYDRLEKPSVREGLLRALEERHGPDVFSPSRTEHIEEFLQTYNQINCDAYGRLKNLRDRGIAHMTPEEMLETVTLDEIRTMVGIVRQLASTLRNLCPSQIVLRADMLDTIATLRKRRLRIKCDPPPPSPAADPSRPPSSSRVLRVAGYGLPSLPMTFTSPAAHAAPALFRTRRRTWLYRHLVHQT